MPEEKLRVFISWSGDLSKAVALSLRDWLPSLFDRVDPWMSDTDIASGARGLEEIHTTLAGCSFGVIVVTEENQNSSWLNYESGAISKSISESQVRVVPLLVDLSGPTQLTGPLAQFQARKLDQPGVLKVVETMASHLGVNAETAKQRFQAFWPVLDSKVQNALESNKPSTGTKAKQRPMTDMLEEVLTQVRELTRTVDTMPSGRGELMMFLSEIEDIARDLMQAPDAGVAARGEHLRMLVHMLVESYGIPSSFIIERHRRRRFPPLEREPSSAK